MATDTSYSIEEIELQAAAGQLGVTLGLNLAVSEVAAGSPADGKIKVGDRIVTVNGELVKSAFSLQSLLSRHAPNLFVRIFHPRPGFDYVIAQIDFFKNINFGLYIKDAENRVFVEKIDAGRSFFSPIA